MKTLNLTIEKRKNGILMGNINFEAAIEAVLFASGEPILISKLAEVIGIDTAACRQQLEAVSARYEAEDRGLFIAEIDGMVQLCTKPAFAGAIKKAFEIRRDTPLSNAAMEVLAIIAYNQPVTRGFVEQVRGVSSASIMQSLAEKGLIEESGRLDVPGRPIAYKTTPAFLRTFSLKSLDELPPLPGDSLPNEQGEQLSFDS